MVWESSHHSTSRPGKRIIRWPLLARGAKAAEFGYHLLFNSIGSETGVQQSASSCLRIPDLPSFTTPRTLDLAFPWKPISFQTCLQGSRNQKNRSQSHRRHNGTPNPFKNDCFEQLVFAKASMRTPGFQTPRRTDFDSSIGTTSDLEASSKQKQVVIPRCQTTSQRGVPQSLQNSKESDSGPPRVHPAAPMVPRMLAMCKNGLPGCQNGGAKPPKWRSP